jgi:DNA repair ATPase RecN
MWRLKSDFSNYEPLTISPDQVFNVYVGLRRGAEYETRYKKAKTAILQLNDLVQSQTEEIKAYAAEEIKSSKALAELNSQLVKKAEEIQSLKDKKAKWYNSPFLYATLGLIGGVLIAK